MARLLSLLSFTVLFATAFGQGGRGATVEVNVAPGLFDGSVNGRVVVMFSPPGTDPLDDYDDTSSKNYIFGKDVRNFTSSESAVLIATTDGDYNGVIGWPKISIADLPWAAYRVQAYLTRYDTVTRSDGSTVTLRFPCGDGSPQIDAPGSLISSIIDVNVSGETIRLTLNEVTPRPVLSNTEIGGCAQGNYEDVRLLKYVKIRSEKLSQYWNRDMYVGANVLLPKDYSTGEQRYPVIYSQGHWPAEGGPFGYPDAAFSDGWDKGIRSDTQGPAPKLIMVTIRHEAPYYDDSYAVNSANLGPWGDAINEELIPYIDQTFRTIAEPWARIQEGGSTGGWISAASVIFRPDLFGYCFSYYPDSLDFHRHQDIYLYDEPNAYYHNDGSSVPSIRVQRNGSDFVLVSTESENHWELSFGSRSRSNLQWDIWNAVFGAQGYNNYPLEPWNKVTGEIDREAVRNWRDMDLANHIVSNWDNKLDLGNVLKGRIFIYVGSADTYYLNEGVVAFQEAVSAKGGPNWANVTIFPGKTHGGLYQLRPIWDYLGFLENWISDHAPTGKTPLSPSVTVGSARGNIWQDVQSRKGRQAAIDRQANPVIIDGKVATVGSWDSAVVLKATWQDATGKNLSEPFVVDQCDLIEIPNEYRSTQRQIRLAVTGTKNGYDTETRISNLVVLEPIGSVTSPAVTTTTATACRADNCARAVTGTAGGSAVIARRSASCASFQACTTVPAGKTIVVVPSGQLCPTRELKPKDKASGTTICPTDVPSTASACSGTMRFASACSCFGFTKTFSTVPTPTVTLTM